MGNYLEFPDSSNNGINMSEHFSLLEEIYRKDSKIDLLEKQLKVAIETLRHMVFENDDNTRWYSSEASQCLAKIAQLERKEDK
jgi:uncharacterized protein YfeS